MGHCDWLKHTTWNIWPVLAASLSTKETRFHAEREKTPATRQINRPYVSQSLCTIIATMHLLVGLIKWVSPLSPASPARLKLHGGCMCVWGGNRLGWGGGDFIGPAACLRREWVCYFSGETCHEKTVNRARDTRYELGLQLPLFDFNGDGKQTERKELIVIQNVCFRIYR